MLILADAGRSTFSDESSSEEELETAPMAHRTRITDQWAAGLKNFDDEHDLVIMQWPHEQRAKNQKPGEDSPDRSSPPLYEVELTASDEDDDGSVLELVIPMHSSRYQRVPTSSPKKAKPTVVKRYFCSMICCGRK